MAQSFNTPSPKWNWTAKLIVGVSLVIVFAWLLLRFKEFIGPLILAFMLTYLSYPVAQTIRRYLKFSWRWSVTLLYLLLIVIILGLLTLGGLAVVQQSQSLYQIVSTFITVTIPNYVNYLSTQVIVIGKYQIDFRLIDPNAINQQILSTVQPLLGQVGGLLTKVASGAATFFYWFFFILLIAYFSTAESGGSFARYFRVEIPGYANDLRILIRRLNQIWGMFLRGQFILFSMAVAVYTVVLTVLGVHYSVGLALLAGFGRFLPYVGPFIAWTTLGLVGLFQGATIFGLTPVWYVVVIIVTAMLVDSAFDNFVGPKFMGSSLKVHPAAVLVTALVAANLFGFVGLLVAAPLLASVQLIAKYLIRKMFDMDPWTDEEVESAEQERQGYGAQISQIWSRLYRLIKARWNRTEKEPVQETPQK
jgi:predicted PurR-regulated permease PerM